MREESKKFDLEIRTAEIGRDVIRFCRTIKQDTVTRPLIGQIIRSATSIGANYMEATSASSKKDFRNKIFICKKETRETGHWLHMIAEAAPETREKAEDLYKEIQELTLIFGKILSTLHKNEEIG